MLSFILFYFVTFYTSSTAHNKAEEIRPHILTQIYVKSTFIRRATWVLPSDFNVPILNVLRFAF